MDELCKQLNIQRVYSPVYTPEANGRLEVWHCFFKACVAKHIQGSAAEWEEVVPLVGAAYNFFPSGLERVTIHADVWERPNHPICKTVRASSKVLGRSRRPPKNGFVKKLYLLTAENVKIAREGRDPTETTRQRGHFKVNDLVLVRDPTSGAFAPCYMPN